MRARLSNGVISDMASDLRMWVFNSVGLAGAMWLLGALFVVASVVLLWTERNLRPIQKARSGVLLITVSLLVCGWLLGLDIWSTLVIAAIASALAVGWSWVVEFIQRHAESKGA